MFGFEINMWQALFVDDDANLGRLTARRQRHAQLLEVQRKILQLQSLPKEAFYFSNLGHHGEILAQAVPFHRVFSVFFGELKRVFDV